VVLPWDLSVGEMSQFWSRVAAERTFKKEGNISDCAPEYSSDFYPHEYLAKIPRCLGGDSRVKNFTVSGRLSARPSELTIAERVLQGAWGWSRKSPIGRLAVRLLPQTAKGLIKKALRARPMNEILAKGSGK
jgi:hypothetical protein